MPLEKFYNVRLRKAERIERSKTKRGTVGKGKRKRNVLRAIGSGGTKLIKFVK